jgi:RHS repeat-associated protein
MPGIFWANWAGNIMKSNLMIAWVVQALAGLLFISATAAFAQQDINLPPRQDTQSGTGVSYKTGIFSNEEIDLSIGGSGDAGLQLRRTYQSSQSDALAGNMVSMAVQGWSNNFVAVIARNKRTYSPDETPPPNPSDIPLIYSVSTGTKTVSFSGGKTSVPPTSLSQIIPGGAKLVFTKIGTGNQGSGSYFTFTDTDGSVFVFPWMPNTLLQSLTRPDGTKFDYTYVSGSVALKSIFSNRGYAVLFDSVTKACVVNLAEQYVTAISSCPVGATSVTYAYTVSSLNPGRNNLTGVTNALSQTTTYSYVGADHLGCIKDPGQTVCKIQNSYDVCTAPPGTVPIPPNLRWSDKVISQTTGTGEMYGYNYTFVGNYNGCTDFTGYGASTTITAPGNVTTVVQTNGAGMPSSIKDPLNRTTTLGYDDQNLYLSWETALPVSQAEPEGNSQSIAYDARANVVMKTAKAKAGSGLADLVTTASYAAICTNPKTCNKPDYVIDARGNRIDYTYDATHGGILTETKPAGPNGVRPQKRYSYTQLYAWIKNSGGSFVQAATPVWMLTGTSECRTLASCVGTADETRTTITYGATGVANNLLPTVQTLSSGDGALLSTTTKTYDFQGNVLTVDGPLAGAADTTRYRYDALRRVIGEVSPDPDGAGPLLNRATRNTYDSSGNLTKVERGTVTDQGDAAWAAFSALEAVDTVYDLMDRKLKEAKSGGGTAYAVTQYSYDASGRLECTAVRMNPTFFASLPASACSLGTQGSYGHDRITKNIYDAAGQRTKLQLAYGTADQADEETSTYTNNAKLATITDGENNKTTLEYDGHDRLLKTRYPVTTQGALSSSTTDYEQLSYDASGNVTQRRLRDGQVIGSTFDALNRVSLKDLPAPEIDVSYTYDLQNRLLTATQGAATVTQAYDGLGRLAAETTPQGAMSYQYDAAARRTRTTWPDTFYVTQDYLATGEVQYIRENGAASGIGVLATYGFDNLGRRTSITRGNGTVTSLDYDAVSRLSSLGQDVAGTSSDVSVTLTYNPASQINVYTRSNDSFAWGGHYTVNRNYGVNGLNQLTAAGATSLGYDLRGNLTSSGSSAYSYTVENRLIAGPGTTLSYDPTGRLYQTAASAATRFQYDGTDLVAEYNGANALLRRYVHGPGDDEPLVWYEGSGTSDRRWLHHDERGSVIGTSNSAGTLTAINAYDEYGIPAATNAGRFQYTGQTWLPEVGLYYYKARIYSPTLGRFMQTDPIGYRDGINWYDYVDGDPVNRSDTTGQSWADVNTWIKSNNLGGLERIPGDLVELGKGIAGGKGPDWVLNGLPPTLGGVGKVGAAAGLQGLAIARYLATGKGASQAFTAARVRAGFKSAEEVGKVIGWGGGREAGAQALARIGQINKASVAAMREAGLTKEVALAAKNMYQVAVKEGTGGSVAIGRVELMKEILKNW